MSERMLDEIDAVLTIVAPGIVGHFPEAQCDHGLVSGAGDREDAFVEAVHQGVIVTGGGKRQGGYHVEVFVIEQDLQDITHSLPKARSCHIERVVGLGKAGQHGLQGPDGLL